MTTDPNEPERPTDSPSMPSIPPMPAIPPMPPGYGTPPPGYGVPPAYAGAAYGPVPLPPGVELAGVGRRIGAWFLGIVLAVVTLGIGYLIWGLIVWGRGTSPALQVLGCRCWVVDTGKPARFGRMALRDIVGTIATGFFSVITGLISFILFVARGDHRSLADLIGGTIVVHDPNKVLG